MTQQEADIAREFILAYSFFETFNQIDNNLNIK